MLPEPVNRDAQAHAKGVSKDEAYQAIKRRIGEAIALILYFLIDGFEVWPHSHFWALAFAVAGVSAILFAETPTKWWIGASLAIVVMAILVGVSFPASPQFKVVDSVPLWGRHFDQVYKGPNIFAYALQRGSFRAAASKSLGQGTVSVDLLIHLAITNVRETPRRITEYKLSVAESKSGPWTALCPINFKFMHLFWTYDLQRPVQWADDDMLDNQMSAKAIGAGDTISGWTGWICPAGSVNECRPTLLKYTLYDSNGEATEYLESNEQTAPKRELHDWLAESSLKNKQTIDRDFSKEPSVEGVCLLGPVN